MMAAFRCFRMGSPKGKNGFLAGKARAGGVTGPCTAGTLRHLNITSSNVDAATASLICGGSRFLELWVHRRISSNREARF